MSAGAVRNRHAEARPHVTRDGPEIRGLSPPDGHGNRARNQAGGARRAGARPPASRTPATGLPRILCGCAPMHRHDDTQRAACGSLTKRNGTVPLVPRNRQCALAMTVAQRPAGAGHLGPR